MSPRVYDPKPASLPPRGPARRRFLLALLSLLAAPALAAGVSPARRRLSLHEADYYRPGSQA